MSKKRSWFEVYPNNPLATNLSIAGGGLKLISILLLIAAIPFTLAAVLAFIRLISASGIITAFIFMLDEFDEMIFLVFILWSAVFVLRYVSCVLFAKAQLIENKSNPSEQAEIINE